MGGKAQMNGLADTLQTLERHPKGLRAELVELCRGPLHRELALYMREASINPTLENLENALIAGEALRTLTTNGIGDTFLLPSESFENAKQLRMKQKNGEKITDEEIKLLLDSPTKMPSARNDLDFLIARSIQLLECLGESAKLPQIAWRISSIENVTSKISETKRKQPQIEQEDNFKIENFESMQVVIAMKPTNEIGGLKAVISNAMLEYPTASGVIVESLSLQERADIHRAQDVEVDGILKTLVYFETAPAPGNIDIVDSFRLD